MTTLDTAQTLQFPVARNGLRDIAIIGTISHEQPGYSYRRVDGFFIPAEAADRSDFVHHQYSGGNDDLPWVIEVMKQSLLRIWRERQVAMGGLPVPGAELTLLKASDEDIERIRALVALGQYKSTSSIRGLIETATMLHELTDLASGQLYARIEQKHPPVASS